MSTVSPNAPRRSAPKRRGLKIFLGSLAAVVALVLLAVGGYAWHLRSTVNKNVQHQSLLPAGEVQNLIVPQDAQGNLISPKNTVLQDDQGQPIDASTMHIDAEGRVADDENRPMLVLGNSALPKLSEDQQGEYLMGVKSNAFAQPTRSSKAGNSLNFLVIGADKASGGASRSDVIVVAHVSGDRKRVDLIHVPRDLYVPIPGQGKNKINASYAFGGSQLLVQTIQPLIGVPIDHVAKIDFDGFKNMTDALGGVTLSTDEGTKTMNGDEALAWVRERKSLSQGDISRGQRQMQFIRAVLMKGLSQDVLTNPSELSRFLDAGTKNMVVDDALTTGKMQKIAVSLRNLRGSGIKMQTAPWESAGPGPHGMSIVTMSEPQMKVLAEHLSNDTMSSYVDDVSPKSGFGR
ncbi:LCP family protein [Luteococcus sp. H138]|uniref:LCP family protein n=1 Tax=unclassified Luteococcus TaxID=2639923 RepID=UPI00313E0EEA